MESAAIYEFSMQQKQKLGPEDQTTIIKAFKNYDKNGDGVMDESEFKNIMIDIGYRKITDEKCKELLGAQDQNKDGVLQWNEFVDMMVGMKDTDDGKFGTIVEGAGGAMAQIMGADGSMSSYSLEERATFARVINQLLSEDPDCQDRIPMNPDDESLFHIFDNGVAMCKILICIDPDCIDARAINM